VLGSAILMLRYLGEFDAAALIENALMVTLEEGKVRTGDVVGYDKCSSTSEYADEIIRNLGRTSEKWPVRRYKPIQLPHVSEGPAGFEPATRRVAGIDVFLESTLLPHELGPIVEQAVEGTAVTLKMIANRGTKVYPATGAITDCVDQYPARLMGKDPTASLTDAQILEVVGRISARLKWTHIEKLHEFDGAPAYTRAQGED
jgi:isocitrate dehydrogenase